MSISGNGAAYNWFIKFNTNITSVQAAYDNTSVPSSTSSSASNYFWKSGNVAGENWGYQYKLFIFTLSNGATVTLKTSASNYAFTKIEIY